jgi:ABC-type sugar transport system ATPase subunit
LAEPAVRFRGLSKHFGATRALDNVELDIEPGSVHGLVGQNGAGKSTLGKVLTGIYERDSGDFAVFGHPVRQWSPRVALEHGIAMIQQELSLVPELTVAQNVFLGIEEQRLGLLAGRDLARFEELNARAGFRLDPRQKLGELRFADRQKVEILRALARNAQLIVMDEPTSALTVDEVDHLHKIIARLAADGRTVVYISHFLDQVLRACDRITTMRDGQIVRTAPASDESEQSLVTAMLGRPMEITFPDRAEPRASPAEMLLRVDHLRARPTVLDVSFEVHAGEIVGLAGLVGSGRSETLRAVFGADPADGGVVEFEATRYDRRSPLRSLQLGIGMIPEDRRGQGLVSTMSVRGNMSLPSIQSFAPWGLVNREKEKQAVARLLRDLSVVPQRVDEDINTLSGGNQQKVMFGKWLGIGPKLLLLDEPTRGIDVGAKRQIYAMIADLAGKGLGVLLVSSELEEVMGLSDQIYLIHAGRTIGKLNPRETTLDQILFRLFGLPTDAQVA